MVFNSDGTGRGDQAVYRGAFGLPSDATAQPAVATVVDASELSLGANLGWTPAPASARLQAVPITVALKAIGPLQAPPGSKPLAALVYVSTVHVTRRLAWVIETYGILSASSGPLPGTSSEQRLQTGQTVIDATTGRYLEAASF